jgi:hypothetical protein
MFKIKYEINESLPLHVWLKANQFVNIQNQIKLEEYSCFLQKLR